jgi:nucleoside-diphosphate-sugar epimerase
MLTGHTGFKGLWLALWLQSLGARVKGFSNGVKPNSIHPRQHVLNPLSGYLVLAQAPCDSPEHFIRDWDGRFAARTPELTPLP